MTSYTCGICGRESESKDGAEIWIRECGFYEVTIPTVGHNYIYAACCPRCAIDLVKKVGGIGQKHVTDGPLSKQWKCEHCGIALVKSKYSDPKATSEAVPCDVPQLVYPNSWDYHCFCSNACMTSHLAELDGDTISTAIEIEPEQDKVAGDIIQDKTLRHGLDGQLQALKVMSASRERALAITNLQQAIMWLGMDLKRLHDLQPVESVAPMTRADCAKAAYARYAHVTDWKNFRGDPMPKFDNLPEKIREAWAAAACPDSAPITAGNPYPSSYDPSTTKIEPTADGLKL